MSTGSRTAPGKKQLLQGFDEIAAQLSDGGGGLAAQWKVAMGSAIGALSTRVNQLAPAEVQSLIAEQQRGEVRCEARGLRYVPDDAFSHLFPIMSARLLLMNEDRRIGALGETVRSTCDQFEGSASPEAIRVQGRDPAARVELIELLELLVDEIKVYGPQAVEAWLRINPWEFAADEAKQLRRQKEAVLHRQRHKQAEDAFARLCTSTLAWHPLHAESMAAPPIPNLSVEDSRRRGKRQYDSFAGATQRSVSEGIKRWDSIGWKLVYAALYHLEAAVQKYGGAAFDEKVGQDADHRISAHSRSPEGHHRRRSSSAGPSTSRSLGQLHHRQQRIYGVSQPAFARQLAARGMRSF
ncbi:hypothetical protein JCM10207_009290 [Rhodosporidiobolus poonsookiae]